MVALLTDRRLTWQQIHTTYSNQRVDMDDGINVELAVLSCGMCDSYYATQRVKFMEEGKKYAYERTEDANGFLGAIT